MLIYHFAKLTSNSAMKTVAEIRRDNLRQLKKEFKTYVVLAEKAETDAAYFSQVLSKKTPRNMGDDLARKLEIGCKKPNGWMDHEHHAVEEEYPDYANVSPITGTLPSETQNQPTASTTDQAIKILNELPIEEVNIILPLLQSIYDKYRKA
jgi:hypothetical protein